ncbi:MAG: EAL domain-containing protein [Thiothrix sp.]|uniref:putative bifunctional diguanylate cyclase/phosphodiesterase n=1 Tax=Thiothrix sp. TaxID=1032 RepID=UPI00261C36F1|nr:EAL domain-containing protein [Thiothrix sp.]MDD5392308.1 EAL domain-containing protein [Thiothrix sp.]
MELLASSWQNNAAWYLLIVVIVAAFAGILLIMRNQFRKRLRWMQQNMLSSSLADVAEVAVLVDAGGIVDFINPAAEKILKYKLRSTRGKHYSSLFTLIDPVTRNPLVWLEKVLRTDCTLTGNALLNSAGIHELQVSYSIQPLHYAEVDQPSYMLLLRDQTEIHAMQLRLDHMEMHDQQTMLLNSKSFESRLKVAIDQVRQHGVKHAFCLVSMDQFKLVNDSLGHGAGDVLIERISRILKEEIDVKRDVLARLGGDEFGILFQESEPAVAARAAEHIRQRLESYEFEWNKARHKITASIAFVPLYKGLATPNRILSIADAACRVAKDKGGNRIHIYKPNDQEILKQRGNMVWLGRLKKAFEAGNFRLVAQPIHSLEPQEFKKPFHHYEVLIRLYDESNQPISPDEFIPAAEYYSMMPRLDRWVVRQLLQSLKEITQRVPRPIFAVNLSGQSLDEPDFLQFVLAEIQLAGISPAMLCFEITERVAIHNLELAQKFIGTLKSLGCSFSLDDFGTGVSSFGYLKSLPVDYLKIDGSFIKEIATDEVAEAMVRSVNQVGHLMGVQVIAEYVENDRIIQILRDIGVDYGQGYGISKPIPLDEVIQRHRL